MDRPVGRNNRYDDDIYDDPRNNYQRPPPPPYTQPNGRRDYYNDAPPGWGNQPFGVNRRDVDYQSMNGPYDRRGKENYGYNTQNRDGYNMQKRDSRVIGDFGGPVQSKWGHVGQSLIDYQVKPPRRGRQPEDRIIDVTPSAGDFRPEFDPMYGDQPYFEPPY